MSLLTGEREDRGKLAVEDEGVETDRFIK